MGSVAVDWLSTANDGTDKLLIPQLYHFVEFVYEVLEAIAFPATRHGWTDCSTCWTAGAHEPKMTPKNSQEFSDQRRFSTTLTALAYGRQSYRKCRRRLPNIDPNGTAEEWLEQLMLGSNKVRFEICWYKHDDNSPSSINPSCSRSLLKTNGATRVLRTYDRKTASTDE